MTTDDPRGSREEQARAEMAAELEQRPVRRKHRRKPDRTLYRPAVELPQPNPSSLDEQLAEGSRKMGVRMFHGKQIENAPVLPHPDRIRER